MNVHNDLYFMYHDGIIGDCEVLTAYDKGIINEESCRVILSQDVEWTVEQAIANKNKEFSYYCGKAIASGVDVPLADGTVEHFSLTSDDQNNLNMKMTQLMMGDKSVEYHADGKPFKMYSANDMSTIHAYYRSKVDSETAYRNNLKEWINKLDTVEKIREIVYGAEIPEEYWTEGWRNIQNTINISYSTPTVAVQSEEVSAPVEEEQPKESVLAKAVNAVTGKTKKKKATTKETTDD